MSEEKVQLFREKNMQAIDSPEAMHSYLRVTSPSVWLVLGAVIILLIGVVIWSIFGSIETSRKVAVVADEEGIICVVPYECIESAAEKGTITLDDAEYKLAVQDSRVSTITDDSNIYARIVGNLAVGDTVFCIPVDAELAEGVYEATLTTERIQPISLLLE